MAFFFIYHIYIQILWGINKTKSLSILILFKSYNKSQILKSTTPDPFYSRGYTYLGWVICIIVFQKMKQMIIDGDLKFEGQNGKW